MHCSIVTNEWFVQRFTYSCHVVLVSSIQYWEQQICQIEKDIPVRLVGSVKVDHLQSWSKIFPSDRTEMVRSICPFRLISNRTLRNFGLNGKRPGLTCNRSTDIFQSKLDLRIKPTNRILLTVTNLILSCNSPLFESIKLEPICAPHSFLGLLLGARRSAIGHFFAVPSTVPEVFAKPYSA